MSLSINTVICERTILGVRPHFELYFTFITWLLVLNDESLEREASSANVALITNISLSDQLLSRTDFSWVHACFVLSQPPHCKNLRCKFWSAALELHHGWSGALDKVFWHSFCKLNHTPKLLSCQTKQVVSSKAQQIDCVLLYDRWSALYLPQNREIQKKEPKHLLLCPLVCYLSRKYLPSICKWQFQNFLHSLSDQPLNIGQKNVSTKLCHIMFSLVKKYFDIGPLKEDWSSWEENSWVFVTARPLLNPEAWVNTSCVMKKIHPQEKCLWKKLKRHFQLD